MRLFYVDPGLVNNLGHHASSCRFITRELRARGIAFHVLAFAAVDKAVQAELAAIPHFRSYTYFLTDQDPICGWLNAYSRVAQTTRIDLARLKDIGPDDLLYFNSALAAQLLGLIQWLAGLPPTQIPHVVMEFAVDPGMDVNVGPNGTVLSARDPRRDARAVLLRHAALQIPKRIEPHLHLTTMEPHSSAAYRQLLGRPVGVLPVPRLAVTTLRDRTAKRPVTVGVVGHQRPDKGYQLIPHIAALLLKARPDIKLLVHNGDPAGMKETQQALRDLLPLQPALVLDERVADEPIWSELLDACDLLLCPYSPVKFALSYSAVAVEAVANAIPLVAPAATTLAQLIEEFGDMGTTFAKPEPPVIVDAVVQALDQFDDLAARAFTAAQQWSQSHGPKNFVDALLTLAGKTP